MNFSSFSLKVLAASLVLASASGFAANYKGDYKGEAPCPMPPSLMDGFYLGGQVGYDSFRVRQSDAFAFDDAVLGIAGNSTSTGTIAATGWMGGLFLGYGQYFSNFYYLAGEIFGNWSGAEQTNRYASSVTIAGVTHNAAGSEKFEANGTFGLSILPGIKLNDATLGYLRIGYDWTRLKASDTVTVNGTTFSDSNSNTRGGWDLGLGMETLLVQNWSARVEYNHIWYSNFDALGGTFKPSDNQYTLGILYHFG